MKKNSSIVLLGVFFIIAIIVYFKTSRIHDEMSRKVTFSLESEENVTDWKVDLDPYLNKTTNKWNYDLFIQYVGTKPITNITYNYGSVKGTATLTEPGSSSFGSTANLVPKHEKEIVVNIEWDEPQEKNNRGTVAYSIVRK